MSDPDDTVKSQNRPKFKRRNGLLYVSTNNDHDNLPVRRKSLSKNRIYLQTPPDWYKHNSDSTQDVTSSYQKRGLDDRWSFNDSWDKYHSKGRKIVFDKVFSHGNNRNPRKAMIVGERPPLWRPTDRNRAQLPGNLSVDNLRQQDLDWRKYNKVNWNDILESHKEDVNRNRVFIQTYPQKEHWLASIDARDRYPKASLGRSLPYISPRLFNNKVTPTKAPVAPKYVTKDKQGNVYYIVGPGDVTSREYRPFVIPEINKPPPTPKKLNF